MEPQSQREEEVGEGTIYFIRQVKHELLIYAVGLGVCAAYEGVRLAVNWRRNRRFVKRQLENVRTMEDLLIKWAPPHEN